MNTETTSAILSVERLSTGVVVTFADGRSVLFFSSVLYEMIPQGEELTYLPNSDE